MSRIDRYLIRLIVPSVFLGVGFYLSLFVIRATFEITELSLRQGVPFFRAIYIVFLALPKLLVLTIPMGIIFAFLYAISHLQKNHEMLAMLSLGFSRRKIMRSFLLVAFALAVINALILIYVLPRSNRILHNYQLSLLKSAISQNLQPRQFLDGFPNKVVYATEMDTTKTIWDQVYIFESAYPQQRIITAKSGKIFTDPTGAELWLRLKDVITHITNEKKSLSSRYQINTNEEQNIKLKDISTFYNSPRSYRNIDEMSFPELVEKSIITDNLREKNRILIELHQKASLPFACLIFAWLGLAYGLRKPRMKGLSAFLLSLLFIIFYYVVMAVAEDYSIEGHLNPVIASWLPGLCLLALAFFFYFAREHRRILPRIPISIPLLKRSSDMTPGLRRFPTIVDTYLWSIYLAVFLLVMVSLSVLYMVLDFTQIADEIQRHQIGVSIILRYYLYSLPQLLYEEASPVSFLVALALTVGYLERNREFTSLRSLGVSLYRTTVPFIMVALFFAVGGFVLSETLLPLANQKSDHYRKILRGKDPGKISGLPGEYHLIMSSNDHIIGYSMADIKNRELHNAFVVEWNERGELTRHLHADRFAWQRERWIMLNGWEREFDGDQVLTYRKFNRRDMPFLDSSEALLAGRRRPHEMNFYDLRQYIHKAMETGHINPALTVQLWQKLVIPLSMVVLTFLGYGLIFRVRPHKTAALRQIGLSIGIAVVYWALVAFFFKLGEVSALPATLAAFSPLVILSLAGVYAFFDIKT